MSKKNCLALSMASAMVAAGVITASIAPIAGAAVFTFDGGPDGGTNFTGQEISTAANYVGDVLPSPAAGDTALFNGVGSSFTNTAGGFGGSGGTGPGLTLNIGSGQTSAFTLLGNTSGLRLGGVQSGGSGQAVLIDSGAGPVTFDRSGTSGNFNINISGGGGGSTQVFTNNSASVATLGKNAVFVNVNGGTGPHTIQFEGTWNSASPIITSSLENIVKAGAGTLTLTGSGTAVQSFTVSGGTAVIGNATALGVGTTSVTGTGNTLQINNVNANTLTGLSVASANTISFSTQASKLTLATGSFVLGADTLDLKNAFNAVGTYTLIDGVGTSNSIGATSFAGVDNASFVYSFALSGNDGVLTVSAAGAPEPAALGLIAVGAAGLLRRRRVC